MKKLIFKLTFALFILTSFSVNANSKSLLETSSSKQLIINQFNADEPSITGTEPIIVGGRLHGFIIYYSDGTIKIIWLPQLESATYQGAD